MVCKLHHCHAALDVGGHAARRFAHHHRLLGQVGRECAQGLLQFVPAAQGLQGQTNHTQRAPGQHGHRDQRTGSNDLVKHQIGADKQQADEVAGVDHLRQVGLAHRLVAQAGVLQ